MEALLSQFSLLSNQALRDKNFDPSTIEELMKFFEIEAYNSWAAMEADQKKEVQEAEISMREAENYLDSVMENAMEEYRLLEEEIDRKSKAELESLNRVAETAKKIGNKIENAASIASKKYMEAALLSATASMKSAFKGISLNSTKVHPS